MALNKKLIHFQKLADFNTQLAAGNILDTSIVFIKDAKQIYTHGQLYSCSYTESELQELLNNKADAADLTDILTQANQYTDDKVANLVGQAPEALDTVYELAEAMATNQDAVDVLNEAIGKKVDKVTGKGLSTNDYTTAEKDKLAGIAQGATANLGTITGIKMNGASRGSAGVVDLGTVITEHQDISSKLDSEVANATYLKKTDAANTYQPIGDYATKSEIPTKVSELQNDANYIQDDVVSNGVYAVTADGKLIDYNSADATATGVALVAGEHKFMIAKSDATNNGSNYYLYWEKSCTDLSLTNYSKADGTNSYGYLGGTLTPQLNKDFTTWTAGALSDFNGKANTAIIAAASSNARDMCTVLNTFNASDSHNDWYVPACGQLALMYLNMSEINAALSKIGGTALAAERYWSSSEDFSYNAWNVYFSNGYVCEYSKDDSFRVRFVRDISASKPLKERVEELENNKADKDSVYSIEEIDSMLSVSKYEFVDLGLPSGLKWATTNVGATKPEEFGLYFAWGETKGYSGITDDKIFNFSDYELCNGTIEPLILTKYNTNSSFGTVDNKLVLEKIDDAAYQSDKTCRIPTKFDFEELIDNTTSVLETLNGINGKRFTSKTNGNSIFIPASGMCYNDSVDLVNSSGFCWSSSRDEEDDIHAWTFCFNEYNDVNMEVQFRWIGFPIRAVKEANISSKFDPSEAYDKLNNLESEVTQLNAILVDTEEEADDPIVSEYVSLDVLETRLSEEIPTKTSQLTNDSGFLTQHQDISNLATKASAVSNITRNGNTFTATKADGNTFTFTQTDTTYSANNGITLSGTTFGLTSGIVTAGSKGPSSAVTGSNNTTVAIPRITVDTYGRVTGLTSYNLTCKDTTYSAATTSANGLMSSTDKSRLDFMHSSSAVTTLASLPAKAIVTATLSAATTISLASALTVGQSITVICTPTASFTQPIPTSGSFISMDGDSLSVTSGKVFEINILCYASGKYSISCKTAV